jgi:hypothetical protein
LQGDVGRQAWALFPGLEGGYLYGQGGDMAFSKTDLSKMSKEQLIEAALALQHELRRHAHN